MVVATSELDESWAFGLKCDSIAADRSLLVMSLLGTGVSDGGSYKCDGIPMDSLITAAARALATGDPLGALKRVALRDDAGLAWAERTLWGGSIGAGRSIKSIPKQGRFFAPSSPTASSPGSPGSTASSGMAPGKVTRAI
jgi:hypothetical protein